jgi:hypothetical protein
VIIGNSSNGRTSSGNTRQRSAWLSGSLLALSSLLVGLLPGACGGSEPPPQAPLVQPSATVSVAPSAPSATALPSTSAAPSVSPIAAIEPALAQAAQAVLNEVAKTEAPAGAKAVGMPSVNLLGPGQVSETTLSMAPGKCYTVIAVGLPPVNEINLQLFPATTLPGMPPLAEDQMVGPRAVVGKTPNCFKWPLPVAAPARVVTTVVTGQGLVATQVYEQ